MEKPIEQKCLTVTNYINFTDIEPGPIKAVITAWSDDRVFLEGSESLMNFLPKIDVEDIESVEWKLKNFFINLEFLKEHIGAWVQVSNSKVDIVFLDERSLKHKTITYDEWNELSESERLIFLACIYLICDGDKIVESDYYTGKRYLLGRERNQKTMSWVCKGHYRRVKIGKGKKKEKIVFINSYVKHRDGMTEESHSVSVTPTESTALEKKEILETETVRKQSKKEDKPENLRRAKGTGTIQTIVNGQGQTIYMSYFGAKCLARFHTPEEAHAYLDKFCRECLG